MSRNLRHLHNVQFDGHAVLSKQYCMIYFSRTPSTMLFSLAAVAALRRPVKHLLSGYG